MMALKYVTFIIRNRSKFVFRTPPRSDVLVYDRVNSKMIVDALLKDIDYTIIETRGKQYHISFRVIIQYIRNLYSYRLMPSKTYLLTLLKIVQPKVIVTFNHIRSFDTLIKYYDAEYLSIQNGTILQDRLALFENKRYIPNLFCFGQKEIELYNQSTTQVGNFFPVGSLKAGYFYEKLLTGDIVCKYDICLISQFRIKNKKNSIFQEAFYKLNTHLSRFLKSHSINLVIAKRYSNYDFQSDYEDNYYRSIYGSVLLKDNIMEDFSSYYLLFESEIVISVHSTLLHEALGFGRKVFFCNYLINQAHHFHSNTADYSYTNGSYDEFEVKLEKLLSLNYDQYLDQIANDQCYYMNFNPQAPAHRIIRNKIKGHVK